MKAAELKRIGNELKKKYLDQVVSELNKRVVVIEKAILSAERLIGKNSYSDEEIDEISSRKTMSDNEFVFVCSQFDPANLSNCSAVTSFGFDIGTVCSDMKDLDHEVLRILMFDADRNYIGYEEGSDNEPCVISKDTQDQVREKVLANSGCRYAIKIHNHPHYLCATPSTGDNKSYETAIGDYRKEGIDLIDDCIITGYDFYSRNA